MFFKLVIVIYHCLLFECICEKTVICFRSNVPVGPNYPLSGPTCPDSGVSWSS